MERIVTDGTGAKGEASTSVTFRLAKVVGTQAYEK